MHSSELLGEQKDVAYAYFYFFRQVGNIKLQYPHVNKIPICKCPETQ